MASYASGFIREDMMIVWVCQTMGWDYYTYMAQPNWFVDMVTSKLQIDLKNKNKEAQKNNRKK